MSEPKDKPRETSETGASAPPTPGPSPSQALVDQLVAGFREQLGRALEVELRDDIGSTALAYVDHYLGLLKEEEREPIVSLVAAGAGAWFGELVRREIGGLWIGDGTDPRRLRLLLEPQFVHFSPVDLAYEAIFSGSPDPGDPRSSRVAPEGAALDGAYHLRKRTEQAEELDDHAWITERLAEVPEVPEDQFYSLTGRFETLELILQLLASRDLAANREPRIYHLNDYVEVLTAAPSPAPEGED
ncbi:hypothetical protein DB30_08046 [Enhygromyxa salina]|uniref:Uncharacterized protein n=1 Tax=Enhygromyxa salina TaxID=215803 RepID=A0A0C2CV66_9BACT|nr:hypothetical protein [Enhygromyxa salina]KIG13480.1 hypothetical protein DB30_08046 [Enhygromyxa salina]